MRNGGGRAGAKFGPEFIKSELKKLTLPSYLRKEDIEHLSSNLKIYDFGDISTNCSIEQTHLNVAKSVQDLLNRGYFPIVLGGGHDHAYGELLGLSGHLKKTDQISVINIDAHLDLRPTIDKITSGSPFRRAIEDSNCFLSSKNYFPVGIQSHCNGIDLLEFHRKSSGKYWSLTKCKRKGELKKTLRDVYQLTRKRNTSLCLSIDMDAFQYSDAPGTSASQPSGFSASEIIEVARKLREQKNLKTLGIYETAPPLDHKNRTARLAALIIYNFIFRPKW